MGVCLSKRSELSPRVDAGGGSAASRPESTPQRVDEGYGARKLVALSRRLSRSRSTGAGDAAAANEHGREPQRRKIVADDSEAMDTAASGSNPSMPRGRNVGYVDAPPRLRVFSRVFPANPGFGVDVRFLPLTLSFSALQCPGRARRRSGRRRRRGRGRRRPTGRCRRAPQSPGRARRRSGRRRRRGRGRRRPTGRCRRVRSAGVPAGGRPARSTAGHVVSRSRRGLAKTESGVGGPAGLRHSHIVGVV
jgi:hypothetical protein